VELAKQGRSNESNTLRADLKAGRLIEQAVHQARLSYRFNPSAYSFECLSGVLRLQERLRSFRLLAKITSAPSRYAAETAIDVELAALEPTAKTQLLDEVAGVVAEPPAGTGE
jgi:hypothetical protein